MNNNPLLLGKEYVPMSDNDGELDDILNDIRFGSRFRGGPKGQHKRCVLMEKVEALPSPYKEAVKVALDDKRVSNPQIHAYINEKWPEAEASLTSVVRHRSRHGCHICPSTTEAHE